VAYHCRYLCFCSLVQSFDLVVFKKFLEDTELACDEQVLANCGEDEKKAYAMALVDCAESMGVFAHRSVEQKYGCVLTVFCLTGSCQLFRLQV